MTFGGNLLISNAEASAQQIVRGITLGFNTDFDPATGLFNTTNFPGASSAQLTARAQHLRGADRPRRQR